MHRLDVRDAGAWADLLDGVDAVCHQAAMVGAGVTVADLPLYAAHNDLGTAALLAAMHERAVGGLVLARSMVVYGEGRYACPEHGEQRPRPRSREALDAGDFENHCPVCGRPLAWELVPEDARLDPRSSYAASKVAQEHYAAGVGAAGGGAGDRAEVPQRLRARHAARHAVLRCRGDLPVVARARASRRRSSRTAARCATSCTSTTSPARTCSRSTPWPTRPAERGPRTTSARGAGPDRRRRRAPRRGAGGLAPEVTGGYRLGDVRHVVASPELATTELGFTAEMPPARESPISPRRPSGPDAETPRRPDATDETPNPAETS